MQLLTSSTTQLSPNQNLTTNSASIYFTLEELKLSEESTTMPFPDCIKLSENHLTTPRASRFIAKRQPLLCNFYWEKFPTDKFLQTIFTSPMLILIINLSKSSWKDNLKISITWFNNTKKSSKKINFTTLFLDSTKSLLELV